MSLFSSPTYDPSSSSIPQSLGNLEPQIIRRSANYVPCIWGDRFLEYRYNKTVIDASTEQVEELKEEVRQMLKADESSETMNLIDTLQRLGVAYHFEVEIGKALEQLFNKGTYCATNDLYTNALHFRLLRQEGYNVSCNVFAQYKDSNGYFIGKVTEDLPSILSLYEASHFRVHGEDILDEALAVTTSHLMSMVNHLNPPLAKRVSHALRHPIHKTMPRLEAKHYISIYLEDDKHHKQLLQLAKLDYNLIQSLHLKELSELSKWWRGLQFVSKLPFARDRLVECYFMAVFVYFEPQYSLARVILTKVIAMTSIIDDIYDVYGMLEELELFTDAINRWDICVIDQLPEYMQVAYVALLDVYNEIENEMAEEGRTYFVFHGKELMKDLINAYLVEAKWFYNGYIPTMEEYMHIALITSTYSLLIVTSFIGMGDIVPRDAVNWMKNNIIPTRAASIIGRLMDDIVSHEFEQERGHVASAVECYMKQYSVSEQEACDELNRRVDQAWKDLNKGCLKPTVVPKHLLMPAINLARIMDVLYKYKDGYTHSHLVLTDYIISLLIEPIPM